jgi:type III pantothenate kinase
MKSGILMGNASMIDGLIDRINDELGYSSKVVATGGLAKTVIPLCKNDVIVDDGLLLKGLSILYNKNIDNNKVKNPNLP